MDSNALPRQGQLIPLTVAASVRLWLGASSAEVLSATHGCSATQVAPRAPKDGLHIVVLALHGCSGWFRWSCVKSGVGLSDPYGLLPTLDTP